MRFFLVSFLAFSLLSCKAKQQLEIQKLQADTYKISNCLSDGDCTLEVIPNATIIMATDEFNNGYMEIKPSTKTLLKYRYKRHELPGTADANYEELLFIELNEQNKGIILKDGDLQDVKLTYGRLCYCKGTSGYFKVTKGDLSLKIVDDILELKTIFEIPNIPQLINLIDIKVALK